MGKPFRSFQEFWPYYLEQHSKPVTRALHVAGNLAGVTLLAILILLERWALLPLVLVVGYGFSWVGHFFFEKNKPATFVYPGWSLRAEFRMVYRVLLGKKLN